MTRVAQGWKVLGDKPGGPMLFSKLLGAAAPYSSTIAPRVVALSPGLAKVRMRDRRAVRNHLKCIHAVALMNLAELTCNLAVLGAVADDQRMIVSAFRIEFLKKARGTIVAECHAPRIEPGGDKRTYEIEAVLTNADGVVVARGFTTCLVSGKK